jgi:sugar phosphate isomerase/epimerase
MLPRVTFSTLACPHWTIDSVIQNARAMGYDGIEWRGGDAGHLNPNATRDQRATLRAKMRDANLFSLAVTSYTNFVSEDAKLRAANVDALKNYLDLAADAEAKFVRVFLGELEPFQKIAEMYPRILESLQQCVAHARAVNVGIAVEHHDDFVRTQSLVPILQNITAASVGAVWDIANAHSANESADDGANDLRGRISYVQIKDGIGRGAQWRLTNVGEGDVELKRAVALLYAQQYQGAFSIEWEYAWHPELQPPERALPHALQYTRALLQEIYA